MAADEYFLEKCEKNIINGIFRLYKWDKQALTIGYFFKKKYLDIRKIKRCKIPLIRRLTGGNMICHDGDLSYSLILNKNISGLKTIKEIYLFTADLFKKALERCGIKAFINKDLNELNNPVCFDSVSQYEITDLKGNKIIASSQKMLLNSFLQHGSFYFDYDLNKTLQFIKFRYKIITAKRIKYKYDYVINENDLIGSVTDQIDGKFKLIGININDDDISAINNLIKNKYKNDEWTYRK